jgi:hypothetical protein
MAVTFTAEPKRAERERLRKERRKAERDRLRREREAYERAQRAREEEFWQRFRSGSSSNGTRSAGIAIADQALALEIINAGYRILSLRNHPDHGGSHDKMVEINRVGDALRALVGKR